VYGPAPMQIEVPFLYELGFDGLYGLEVTEVSDELMRGQVAVRDELKQAAGLVHGGVYASIAESLASMGTALAVMPDGKFAMGLSNQTSFLRPITDGTIHAEAKRKHRGRTTWVWEVEISDDQGNLCVLTRMTVAVREAPEHMKLSLDARDG
jgi:1,4-dihydroxy-2-naphthoyl-CoA hydrolase